MKRTLLNRIAYAVISLSLAFLLHGAYKTSSGTPAAATTTTAVQAVKPTRLRYNCGDPQYPDFITFNWTRPMPQGGWLGTLTYGGVVNKPIQVFDAKTDDPRFTNWAIQAQDGSFVCRMHVSTNLKRDVWIGDCTKGSFTTPACGTDRLTINDKQP